MAEVYILQLGNGHYYIGSTTDLERRISEHIRGLSRYTSGNLPVRLVFHQAYKTHQEACRAEIWLKKQKDSTFLQRIISEGVLLKSFH